MSLYWLHFPLTKRQLCISFAGPVVWESNYRLEFCSRRHDSPSGIQTTSVHKTITNHQQNHYTILRNVITAAEECVIWIYSGRAWCRFISLTRWSFHDAHTTWPDAEGTLIWACSVLSFRLHTNRCINHPAVNHLEILQSRTLFQSICSFVC